ncbi:hypothetical protein BABINDRAFT_159345 [Babjeviella inositovora NRRL Y-12698]|uniref:NAD(+) diphosphatase n=1 Tax=Babjeviella inositovora NRRL Y-12698 TaxID=984486 RepID=A0A1E3R0E0_9ASCO|nr:uncharacterized protein BABINDRAFT_159345 [Babjeviella inositovora NRRL Y-12698]ODQ82847.1 hypothetical protein BABINDRAFT_159345 [Babjeviella inositovora NRRL Y-12698]
MSDQKQKSYQKSGLQDLYFGQECLNRLSFLREDYDFLKLAGTHPSAKLLVMVGNNAVSFGENSHHEEHLTFAQNKTTVAYMKQWLADLEGLSAESRAAGKPIVVFLGIKDLSVGFEPESYSGPEAYITYKERYTGIPYFAFNFPRRGGLEAFVEKVRAETGTLPEYKVLSGFQDVFKLSNFNASIMSHARMYVDWIHKNQFCGGCGSRVVPIFGGSKLRCLNNETETVGDKETPVCPVKQVLVSNLSFPRTDCVVITAPVTADHSKILLGTSKRWKGDPDFDRMWSCIAGFVEPLETIEVATKRECWEETGVVSSSVHIMKTQPWPFPVNLMIGCITVVEENGVNEMIHLGHDAELLDAKWFEVSEIKKMIESKGKYNPFGILLPKSQSIAFQLIKMVAFNEVNLTSKI